MKRNICVLYFVLTVALIYGIEFDKDDLNFHFQIGAYLNTCNFMNVMEDIRMGRAIISNSEYINVGMTKDQAKEYVDMPKSIKTGVMIANIVGSFEFGFKYRVKWNVLLFDSDVSILFYDGSYNSRLDFEFSNDIGIRMPYWIMPYASCGPNYTLSFYQNYFDLVEDWRTHYLAYQNVMYRIGFHARLGVDFNLKKFSIGLYYQYTIKDFDEFGGFCFAQIYVKNNFACAAIGIFAYQSRLGVSLLFPIEKL
jgi:hypothetical protein